MKTGYLLTFTNDQNTTKTFRILDPMIQGSFEISRNIQSGFAKVQNVFFTKGYPFDGDNTYDKNNSQLFNIYDEIEALTVNHATAQIDYYEAPTVTYEDPETHITNYYDVSDENLFNVEFFKSNLIEADYPITNIVYKIMPTVETLQETLVLCMREE